jgi:hypothetical protein
MSNCQRGCNVGCSTKRPRRKRERRKRKKERRA